MKPVMFDNYCLYKLLRNYYFPPMFFNVANVSDTRLICVPCFFFPVKASEPVPSGDWTLPPAPAPAKGWAGPKEAQEGAGEEETP